ncbi:LMBR1-like membrane protein-domain-containing protein [Xylariaceae sp. FL1272]|nr:LMBR1-like membrane protein-domain-containing protein [Xylariaceae sp. FL1272]
MAMTSSSQSPVGSIIFASVALILLSILVLIILRRYLTLRATPAYLILPVFFGLWLPASIVLLVPIDLASNASPDDDKIKGIWLPHRALLVAWRISYWLTFVLTWFIFPIFAEYSDAGYREPKDRLLYSLRSNAQYYAIVLSSGILGLVYFFVSYQPSLENVKGLVMALAYCWGLVLAIYLMGHGLVAIPRNLIRDASASRRLRRLQSRAPKLYETMEDSILTLEELEFQVSELSKRKTGSAKVYLDWIEELAEMCSIPESRPRSAIPRENDSRIVPNVITEKYLADLTRQLVRAKHAKSRYVDEWDRLLHDAARTRAILDSSASKRLVLGAASPSSSFLDRLTFLTPYTRYLLHCRILPYARVLLGSILALASVCITWSELVRGPLPALSVIRFTVVHHWTGDSGRVGFAGQIVAIFWISYMCAAALHTVTNVKVWRGRALVRRNTAHESAFWYAGQVARLSVPLSYNFVTFMSPKIYMKTVFYELLGKYVDLSALGNWFDNLFPIFVLFPVLATLFGLYGRIKRFFGFGVDIVDEDEDEETAGYGTGSWREGRELIERELNGTSISRGPARRDARAQPILTVPGRDRNEETRTGTRTPFATSPQQYAAASSRPAARGRTTVPAEPSEEEDGNFFENLGHRFKNTIDTIDKPKWLQEIGDGFKAPKWMSGRNNEASGSGSRSGDNDIRRWFGGDGRIRL